MRWLTATTFLPLAGVAVLLLWPRMRDEAARVTALVVSTATFVVSLGILGRFDGSIAGFQMVEEASWVRAFGMEYLLGVDGVSLFMVLLTTFLMPLAILASWKVERSVRVYMAAMLVLETAMVGSFLALDLLLFFVFFEAILFLFFRAGVELGQGTFDVRDLTSVAHGLPVATARWLFVAFFVAFAVKVPLFPLHTWLPDAHVEAPTAGSLILAAVLLKVGAYGLIRFNLGLFPEASRYFADAVSILALVGIVYGAVVAMMQIDVKRLVAYSSVSHLGFVVLGTFAFNEEAAAGGVLQMVNHGLSTGALFLLVGMIYERTHTRELDEMGGLGKVAPWLAGVFLVTALSSLGLPGLNNFVGEFLVILGTFAENRVYGAIAASGVVLAAIYLLWAYQRMAHGPVPERNAVHPDLSLREGAILAPLLAAMLLIGVYPRPFLDRIEPTTNAVVRQVAPPAELAVGAGD